MFTFRFFDINVDSRGCATHSSSTLLAGLIIVLLAGLVLGLIEGAVVGTAHAQTTDNNLSQSSSENTVQQQPSVQADSAASQRIDDKLRQAMQHIDSVNTGLESLQEHDVKGFNQLGAELRKAAELMQDSESKGHPSFQFVAQQWTVLQKKMLQIATRLQQTQTEEHKASAEPQTKPAGD